MLLTAVLIPAAEGGFTALNPETGTTTQGESVEEALANLREATELYLEEFPITTSGQPLVTTFQVTVDGLGCPTSPAPRSCALSRRWDSRLYVSEAATSFCVVAAAGVSCPITAS